VQALLDSESGAQTLPDDWRLRVEDAIGRLESEMIEVRQHIGLPWQSQESHESGESAGPAATVQSRPAP
jgi:hypothetical protein